MKDLNYSAVLTDLQDAIANRTVRENHDIAELLLAHINTIYGLICIYDGALPDIFPVRSTERARKFMVYVHTISAFQFASSICNMLVEGQYPEANALTRSLIETVAFAEYYKFNPDMAFQIVRNPESLPHRSTAFRFLAKNGRWPSGGPKRAFERHNIAAHGNIVSVVPHWMEASGNPQKTEIWIRRYNPKSFYDIAKAQVIPLLGIQQVFRDVFIDETKLSREALWVRYWSVGHDRERIMRLFPEIVIPSNDVSENHA